jgi:hypothetical protein
MKAQPLKYGSERRMAITSSNSGVAWGSSEISVVDLILFVVLVVGAPLVQKVCKSHRLNRGGIPNSSPAMEMKE